MIRALAAVAAFSILSLAGAASAQTWGQPIYLNGYGRPVGGTPLSEVETRSYVETGRWADGYADRPYVRVPGGDYRYEGYGGERRYGHRGPRYDRPYQGYRDEWGYNDDRPRASYSWSRDRGRDRRCDCPDVYLYDR